MKKKIGVGDLVFPRSKRYPINKQGVIGKICTVEEVDQINDCYKLKEDEFKSWWRSEDLIVLFSVDWEYTYSTKNKVTLSEDEIIELFK